MITKGDVAMSHDGSVNVIKNAHELSSDHEEFKI
jgi:hypothetical protein